MLPTQVKYYFVIAILSISFTVWARCHPLFAFLLNVVVQRSPFNALTTASNTRNIKELTGSKMFLSGNKTVTYIIKLEISS